MLDERLRNHIDAIAPPLELSEVLARAVSDDEHEQSTPNDTPAAPVLELRQSDPTAGSLLRLAGAAAAVLVLLAGGLLFLATRDEGTPLVLVDNTDEALPVLPGGLSDVAWRKVDEPFAPLDAGNAVQVNSAVVANGVAWAAGFEWRIDFANDRIDARKRGAIWRSDDGENWTSVDADFGSLDIPGGNWAPSGISFDHIVTTADGAILAFGNEFRFTIRPVGYRSVDGGSSWEELDLSALDSGAESTVVSASASGNEVMVVITDFGSSPGEPTRIGRTDSGTSWQVDDQPVSASDGFAAILSDGELASVTNADLPGEAAGPKRLAGSDAGFVTSGAAELLVVADGSPVPEQAAFLWHSTDGRAWRPVERQGKPDAMELGPRLLAHNAGVLAAIEWIAEADTGVSLVDVRSDGNARSLGETPSATLRAMFVLDDRLFIIGSDESAALDERAEEDASIWVSEVSDSEPSVATDSATPAEQASALVMFERCVAVLDGPDFANIPVIEEPNHGLIVQEDAPDPRARLCQDVINERLATPANETSEVGSRPISPEQSEALADGVTAAEYELGWERFESCMERGGGTVERDSGQPGHTWSYPDASVFLHDVCYPWHFGHLDSIWQVVQNESDRSEDREIFIDQVVDARSAVAVNARGLFLTGLTTDTDGCQTTYGDRWWITTFDSMPQPLCLVVGEEQDLDFWNKGFATAVVDWAGDERTLRSDSSFETGRIGDTFPGGRHTIAVEPYGDVTLVVVPTELSVMAELELNLFWNADVVLGLPATEVAALLGVEFEVGGLPRDGCAIARVAHDPYSPQFLLFGDETIEGSVVVSVTYSDDVRC